MPLLLVDGIPLLRNTGTCVTLKVPLSTIFSTFVKYTEYLCQVYSVPLSNVFSTCISNDVPGLACNYPADPLENGNLVENHVLAPAHVFL